MTEISVNTVVAIVALTAALACSGGAKDDAPGNGDDNSGDTAACPHAKLDDVWLDKRVGCLSVGQLASQKVASAPGARAERAFIVKQQTLDSTFTNVLGSGNKRAFKYLVCVHDAPPDLDLPFATDLVGAFKVHAANPHVGASTLTIGGAIDTPCDTAIHPVILNGDGTVESINPGAVSALEISDGH